MAFVKCNRGKWLQLLLWHFIPFSLSLSPPRLITTISENSLRDRFGKWLAKEAKICLLTHWCSRNGLWIQYENSHKIVQMKIECLRSQREKRSGMLAENLFGKQDTNFKDQFIRLKVCCWLLVVWLKANSMCHMYIYFHATKIENWCNQTQCETHDNTQKIECVSRNPLFEAGYFFFPFC